MSSNFISGLYEAAAGIPDANGISKLDEQKLQRHLKQSSLGRRNEDIFAEETKSKTCPRYHPCPICLKCMNKSSALYVSCQTCKIPTCNHSYDQKEQMIKRKNFVHYVTQETMDTIIEMDKRNVTGKHSLKPELKGGEK